jgi:Dolichyl-phosphate-mannose-protein mannosyltransferase
MTTASMSEPAAADHSDRVRQRETAIPRDSRLVTFWILTLGALLCILSFAISENNGTDALARASLTADLLAHPRLKLAFGDWPPVHFWLMAALATIIGNVGVAVRLLSLFTGLASLWVFWRVTHELYSRTAANLSLLVFALYSLHISYSVTSSSEAPYLFFVLIGLLCFLIYHRSGQLSWIAVSGLSLTVAAGMRYEAWVVLFGTVLALIAAPGNIAHHQFWRSTRLRALLVLCATGGSWPVFWMAYCWSKWGHPLYFVAMNHQNVARTIAVTPTSGIYRAAVLPGSLLITLCPLAFLAAVYSLWLSVRERRGWQLTTILATLAVVQFYQVMSGGVMAFARYTITIGTLLAVASGYGLERLSQRYFPGKMREFCLAVAVVLFLNLGMIFTLGEVRWRYSEKFGAISPRVRFPHYIEDLAANLRSRMRPEDSLVVDDYRVQSNIVAAAAGLPLLTDDRAFLVSTVQPTNLQANLQAYVSARHPRFLVYSDAGALRPYLTLSSKCSSTPVLRQNMKLDCLFANEVYQLYEITYLDN